MAELARVGGVVGCPTEISECFCNLEEGGRDSGAAASSTGRRKLRSGTGSMLLHLTPKQILVARKPTLMDDLITRHKTALLRKKMERTRGIKSKRSDLDSEPDVPLAVKRLRSNDPIDLKRSKPRKRDVEDRKVRVTTRHFMSSLRSGKKRTHLKEAGLLVRKRKTLKSSGSRSNDSETDTPLNNSSRANGHSIIINKDKQEDKTEKSTSQFNKAKPTSESKPSSSQIDTKETPTKKIRKKRRKVDSMIWLKKPSRAKQHSEVKPPIDVVIKTEPILSQSEPEDSGLGSEVKLDLGKVEDRSDEVESHTDTLSSGDKPADCLKTSGSGSTSSSGGGKPVWNIVPFQVSPFKNPNNSETNTSLDESMVEESEVCSENLLLPDSDPCQDLEPVPPSIPEPESAGELEQQPPTESPKAVAEPCETDSLVCIETDLDVTKDLPSSPSNSDSVNISKDIPISEIIIDLPKSSPVSPELVNSEISLVDDQSLINVESDEKIESIANEVSIESSDVLKDTIHTDAIIHSDICQITNTISLASPLITNETQPTDSFEDDVDDSGDLILTDNTSQIDDSTKDDLNNESIKLEQPDSKGEEIPQPVVEEKLIDSCELSIESINNVTVADSEKTTSEEPFKDTQAEESSMITDGEEPLSESDDNLVIDQLQDVNNSNSDGFCDISIAEIGTSNGEADYRNGDVEHRNGDVEHRNGQFESINGCDDLTVDDRKEIKAEEGVERQALKVDLLKALGLQSLRPVEPEPEAQTSAKEVKEEKPSKVTEPGYTGTLKAVIKLNKGAPRSIVFKNNDESKPEYQICTEAAASNVPITHLAEVSTSKKVKDIVTDFDTVSNSSYVSTAPQSDSAESEEDKPHGKESNLIIPEKSSSFSIHPGRLCCDVCCYCFGKFGSLDTPCHIAQLKGEERQQKILQNEPYLTLDSCLCDACYRYVDRKANCPSSAAAKTAKRARPPAATLCCVTDCTQPATHSVKRKWLLKIKRSLANKFEIDTEKHTSVFNPLCSNHHYWVDYYMVCGICRKRLNRNHLYTLGPETDRLNLVLAEDGIPARLSDKLFLCKLCRYYATMRLKYSDPTTIPQSSQPFYVNYRKKILASLDVPVSDSDDDKPKPKEGKDEDVMSLSGLATLLSDQPDPTQPRIQVKFGNVNIGTLSNLNIGQGRQEERPSFDRSEPSNLPLNAAFDFQGPSTSDGSWEKVTSTLQFDKKTKQLWQDLQRPYGNQSSFLRHLVMLEKYWRSGYLVLSDKVDPRAAKYINSVQTRNKSFEGKSEVKELKVETPPPPPSDPTPPPNEPILKVPDPSKRFLEEAHKHVEQPKTPTVQPFCPIIPTGEVEVLPVNPNKMPPKEKHVSKGTLIIQRPVSSQSQPTPGQNPCKIMITSVQSLAKPKVDPVLLNRAKSLVRMVSPGVTRQRVPLPVPIQRLPRVARPRQMQYLQQPYQTLQAQLQAPPSNHPLQSLQQVVLNRYPPPPLVKINQQVAVGQHRALPPRPQSTPSLMQQQHSSASMMQPQQHQSAITLLQQLQQPLLQQQHHQHLHQQPQQPSQTSATVGMLQQQQQQSSVSLLQHQQQQQHQASVSLLQHQQQQLHPSVSLMQHQQLQPSVSLIQQPQGQPVVALLQQPPTMSVQLQGQSVSIMQNPTNQQLSIAKAGPPPPYPLRPLLPKLPPSLSISTMPQTSIASMTPSVSLLPPSSPNGVVSSTNSQPVTSTPLPPISTLTSSSSCSPSGGGHLPPPPPYSLPGTPPSSASSPISTPSVSVIPTVSMASLTPAITMIPASLPSSITLPSSGITIEKQPHNFHTPPILPPEKPIISVFREPLPTDT